MDRGIDRDLRGLLEDGAREGVYPGAVLLAASRGEIAFLGSAGFRSLIPERLVMEEETVFDLASLTKPLATTLALMQLVGDGRIGLDDPLGLFMGASNLGEKKDLTARLLLSHSAGLADWKPFYLGLGAYPMDERKKVLRQWIIGEPFAYGPGEGSLYSDLGFMLLEWLIEGVAGTSLRALVREAFYGPLSLGRTFLGGADPQSGIQRSEFAATEDCPWRGRVLQGEVHDENASALGGFSGHAGLFGTAEEVFALADLLGAHYRGERQDFLRPETVRTFLERQDSSGGGTWALGWDTPSPEGSSAGRFFRAGSVGHLGFTGTSLWMDLDRDVVVVFLTNRVHPVRHNDRIKAFRPRVHDAVMRALGMAS